MTTTSATPAETPDEDAAWLQDHAIPIFGRPLNPASEVPTWAAYLAFRGKQQTILNFWSEKANAGPYPA